jgi:hypothetical protein
MGVFYGNCTLEFAYPLVPTLNIPYRKIPWKLSSPQKYRQRQRLRAVDNVVATVNLALAKKGQTVKSLETWKNEMPTEEEMLPKDKYTMFDRKAKRYRKGVHSTCYCCMLFSYPRELTFHV